MAKIKQPKEKVETNTPDTEAPAPDYSALIAQIETAQTISAESAAKADAANIDSAIFAYEFRIANPNAERKEILLCLATGVAAPRGLKPDDIMTAPDKTLKLGNATQQLKYKTLESAYNLTRRMLSVAWPSGEDEQKAVKKLIDGGERGFVKLTRAAAKRHKNPKDGGATKRYTPENLPEKVKIFVMNVSTDIGESYEESLSRISDIVEVLKAEPTPAPAE